MTYTLQPGTIAHLCFKHLSTIAPGGEISTAELASAIGQPSSAMLPSTQAARNHGLIRARYRDGNQRHLWWSIGDGTPLEKPAVDDSEEDDGPQDANHDRQEQLQYPIADEQADDHREHAVLHAPAVPWA